MERYSRLIARYMEFNHVEDKAAVFSTVVDPNGG